MASSSSSSSISRVNYEVFISFRGQDVRSGFLSHLHKALVEEKIQTFVDDQLIRGEEIESSLLQIIERCAISLVIFSKNFAYSPWCLDELVKISECKERKGQIVIPVLYRVNLVDVQQLTGSFGKAISQHKRDINLSRKVKKWRHALNETSFLPGFDSQDYKQESILVDIIVRHIQEGLNRLFINAKYDVFTSFRGPDVRFGFLSHICKALVETRINTFVNDRLERGEEIESSLMQIIERCAISVVIFSEDYACSPCCLDELVKISECKKTMGKIVIPVYYRVNPAEVMELYGRFGYAISEHKKHFDTEKVENWCQALKETSFVSGFHIKDYKSESELVDKIVQHIQDEQNRLSINVGDVKEDRETISGGKRIDNKIERSDSIIDDDDTTAEKTYSKIDFKQLLDQNVNDLSVTARRYMSQLSRHSKILNCLLAYVAITTTWPLVGSVLLLFIKKKFNSIMLRR